MRNILLSLGISAMLLAGCASYGDGDSESLPDRIADRVVPVEEQYRPLRVCLLAAGVVEVMTDRVQTFDGDQAPQALGRLLSLQGAVDNAKVASPLWTNTDMSDVSYQFAVLLKEVGQDRLSRILLAGPTIGNFANVAARATLLATKGDALLADINSMLSRVNEGTLTEDEVWAACESRMDQNRAVLEALAGARM